MDNKTLYKIIIKSGLVTKKDLDEIYLQTEYSKEPFANMVIDHGLISEDYLYKSIAEYFDLSFVKLSDIEIDKTVLKIIPEPVARSHKIIAFKKDNNSIKIATSKPDDKEVFELLKKQLTLPINIFYASEYDIENNLKLYKEGIKKTFNELLTNFQNAKTVKDEPVEEIVQKLLEYAFDNSASDIHIEPHFEETVIRFRIDGILHDIAKLPKNLHEQIVSRIKVLSRLRTDEHQSAQDGRLQINYGDAKDRSSKIDIRVSITPVVYGENIVMRLLSDKSRQFNLHSLGLMDKDIKIIKSEIAKTWGTIIVVGPTGSGKTTTLYSILKMLNKREVNIATIEDPVEYDMEGINQIQVNAKTNLSFANGLRSIVRQDPDIVMIGEIRDEETAGIAVNAAMTGHLVLTTLHANDTATTLPRLIDMNIEPYLISSTINLIIAQRIVRKLCSHCLESYSVSIEMLKKNLPPRIFSKVFNSDLQKVTFFKGKGCPICHGTGYAGRTGIFELMTISPEIKNLIMEKADATKIAQKAIEEGMKTMLEDGLEKVMKGDTSFEEVLRITRE